MAVDFLLLSDDGSSKFIIVDNTNSLISAVTANEQPGDNTGEIVLCTTNVGMEVYENADSASTSNLHSQFLMVDNGEKLAENSGSDSKAPVTVTTTTYEAPFASRSSLKRKKIANRKRVTTKRKRLFGEAYLGYKRFHDGVVQHDQNKPARQLGIRCEHSLSKTKGVRSFMCGAVTEERRVSF